MKPILEQSLSPYQGKVLLWSSYRSSLPLSILILSIEWLSLPFRESSWKKIPLNIASRRRLLRERVKPIYRYANANSLPYGAIKLPINKQIETVRTSSSYLNERLSWTSHPPIQFHSSGGIHSKTCMQNRDDSTMRHGHYKEKIGREKGLTLS